MKEDNVPCTITTSHSSINRRLLTHTRTHTHTHQLHDKSALDFSNLVSSSRSRYKQNLRQPRERREGWPGDCTHPLIRWRVRGTYSCYPCPLCFSSCYPRHRNGYRSYSNARCRFHTAALPPPQPRSPTYLSGCASISLLFFYPLWFYCRVPSSSTNVPWSLLNDTR